MAVDEIKIQRAIAEHISPQALCTRAEWLRRHQPA